jgi:hypothetical protein
MALFIAAGGLAFYLLACWILGGWCLILSPIPLVPLLGYSLLKRFTPFAISASGSAWPWRRWALMWLPPVHPRFSTAVILFSGFVFCWLSGADIIYALMDIDHDRKNDIYSLPAWMGVNGAIRVAAGVHLMAWGLLVAVVQTVGGGPMAWLALATSAFFLALMYVPAIPLPKRFFPISTIAGIAGAWPPWFHSRVSERMDKNGKNESPHLILGITGASGITCRAPAGGQIPLAGGPGGQPMGQGGCRHRMRRNENHRKTGRPCVFSGRSLRPPVVGIGAGRWNGGAALLGAYPGADCRRLGRQPDHPGGALPTQRTPAADSLPARSPIDPDRPGECPAGRRPVP